MAKPLVVVESPAKAKTISKFLGSAFDVRASVGHVADLPSKGLAVDVDNGFRPTYELTERGKQVVKDLRLALKDASELYLATDEDREGEAISWHLLEHLKPKVPVKRMVFHEITAAAIDHAVNNPRGIDYGLVDAAETRRILDRLYGYEVSPVLWRRVNRGLSAGRVQSPSIRLIVQRERERIAFVAADYWDIDLIADTTPSFEARLVSVDGRRVATGKDFGDDGRLSGEPTDDDRVALDEATARALAAALEPATFSVRSVEEKPYRSSPKPPFMTSTLQQEGGRRLRLSASQVMRVAQGLYERGYITYMRTDNVTLSDEALTAVRAAITAEYGPQSLSPSPRQYTSKVKNAQEAHEAIRPTTPLRSPHVGAERTEPAGAGAVPADLAAHPGEPDGRRHWLHGERADRRGVSGDQRAGWPRHRVRSVRDDDHVPRLPGCVRRAHQSGGRDEGDDSTVATERESLLPALGTGEIVPVASLTPEGHTTTAPPRYTEASLVKRLEELGIGRPSTWASIIQTIQDRGYVWKKGQALVPTWTAFAVVSLLEQHFDDLVDYAFTARVETDLDAIAAGRQAKDRWLSAFYFGEDPEGASVDGEDRALPGLKRLVEENLDAIDAAAINTFRLGTDAEGNEIVVKPGKFGPYVKRGEDTASVPETMAPDELTVDVALALLAMPKSDEPIGELDGYPVFAKNGRYGPYVQWGTADAPPPGLDKPKMASLFKTMTLEHITMNEAEALLTLPRTLGEDPADGEPILASNGRYGPYIQKGKDYRSLDNEERLLSVTLEEALHLLAQPKVYRRGGQNTAAKGPLREFGNDPVSERPVVAKDGRFGVYVTDGETNASIGRGDRIEEMAPERAFELLAIRREQVAAKGGAAPRKRAPARKSTAKKSGAAKKSATKRSW